MTKDKTPLRISFKDITHKKLPESRVIDPNLTPQQRTEFNKQIHQQTFAEKALDRLSKSEPKIITPISAEEEEDLSELEVTEILRREEIRRGSKIFDESGFQNAVKKGLKNYIEDKVESDTQDGYNLKGKDK